LAKFKEMVATQPTLSIEQLSGITASTLVIAGDDDIVTLEHTASLFRTIPNSELAVVPGASHLVHMEKPELVNRLVVDFLQSDPVPK
jgi:pimeloyl-ACP methyl ester carboxylesterase